MNITDKDIELLNDYYKQFLINLKEFLLNHSLNDINLTFNVLNYLLRNAKFTNEKEMIFKNRYNYFPLPSALSDGIQVMNGICCCRHANTLNYDILKTLGLKVKLQPILIKNNTWIKLNNFVGGNHVITILEEEGITYNFDLVGGFQFKNNNGELIFLNTSINNQIKELCDTYEDKENIEGINRILNKYYNLRKIGVTSIYN